MIGTTLGSFEITAKLGEGGMGEVYRATDTKLGRDVAIKVLPESVATDPERLARFEREARMLAALDHPNIAAIYGLEEADGRQLLVMQLVEGETLQERIQKGAISIDEAIPIALQIAEAFEAAHQKGIIHRDLKPANVKVTADGQVKVLDFGLAKALEVDGAVGSDASLTQSPTLTAQMTGAGVILGTAGYMRPEQARGDMADKRADIWAFGVVLMEMLTGRTLYAGRTVSDTLASVLKDEPRWEDLSPSTPTTIRHLLERCLEKDDQDRLQSIGEARIALRHYLEDPEAAGRAGPDSGSRRGRPGLGWLAAALVVGGIVGGLAMNLRSDPEVEIPVRKFKVNQAGVNGYWGSFPKISPDGKTLLLTTAEGLYLRALNSLESRFLDGTENGSGPFWSPDSQFIGFEAGRKLWKTPVQGGSPSLICEVPGRGRLTAAVWGPEDRIFIAAWRGDLYEVSAQGGDPRMILDLDLEQDIDIHYLSLLPDGETLLFTPHSTSGTFPIEAWVDGERRVVMEIEGQQLNIPILDRSGNLLYERRGTNEGIWAVPFSASQVEVVGEPFLVAPESGLHSVSQDGTLTYSAMAGALSQLAWIDRQNQAQEVLGEPRVGLHDPALSPDGSKVLATSEESGREEVWVFDLQREIWTRLTFEDAEVDAPSWTPDGDRVVYESGDSATSRILVVSSDGTGKPEVLVDFGGNPTLSPDGSTLFFEKIEEGSRELWSQPLDGSQEASRLIDSPFSLRRALVHPSGRYMAFGSNESGNWEVYLTQYPSLQGKWQLSTDGGFGMIWSRDGSRFYFHDSQSLFEIDIEVEPALQLGSARRVFTEVGVGTVLSADDFIDVSPDGERLLVVQSPDFRDGAVGVVVVQNWLGQFQP